MFTAEAYLVRHGEYDRNTDNLTESGVADAERAAQELLALNLGGRALVLSSDAVRAQETAIIIADGLATSMFPCRRMNLGGNDPEGIENLDEWLLKSIGETEMPITAAEDLVVVTHEPLIRVARYGTRSNRERSDPIGYGEIFKYTPGTWKNDRYKSHLAAYLEELIAEQRQG